LKSDVSPVFFLHYSGADNLGYSALAWAEGQKDLEDAEVCRHPNSLIGADKQVVTLENNPLMIAIANDAIMKAEQSSHIRIVEGDALETYNAFRSRV